MTIKENDVYSFKYNEETVKKANEQNRDLYHCFVGILVTNKTKENTLYLRDVYWGNNTHSKSFTLEEAQKLGELEFMFNFDDVDDMSEKGKSLEFLKRNYNKKDYWDLSHQNCMRGRCYLRKGAKKCKETQKRFLLQKRERLEIELQNVKDQIDTNFEQIKKIDKESDFTVW